MPKKKSPPQKTPSNATEPKTNASLSDPWISRRNGLWITALVSILVAVWIFFQGSESVSFGERLLWSFVFGINVWLVFGLVYFFNRFLRKR